jgi:hypothetical protein
MEDVKSQSSPGREHIDTLFINSTTRIEISHLKPHRFVSVLALIA